MQPARTPACAAAAQPAFVRLDIWLWATRFFKTRSLAKQVIEGGRVDVNDAAARPSRPLHVGDRVRLTRGEERFDVEVTALCERRAAAAVAQRCYRETDASRAQRLAAAEQRRLANAGYSKPPGEPDKRARRLLRALGDIDVFCCVGTPLRVSSAVAWHRTIFNTRAIILTARAVNGLLVPNG